MLHTAEETIGVFSRVKSERLFHLPYRKSVYIFFHLFDNFFYKQTWPSATFISALQTHSVLYHYIKKNLMIRATAWRWDNKFY